VTEPFVDRSFVAPGGPVALLDLAVRWRGVTEPFADRSFVDLGVR